jgi:hypothetical protein
MRHRWMKFATKNMKLPIEKKLVISTICLVFLLLIGLITFAVSHSRVVLAQTCPAGYGKCGTTCYDPAKACYKCIRGVLCECIGLSEECGGRCYDPMKSACSNGKLRKLGS